MSVAIEITGRADLEQALCLDN